MNVLNRSRIAMLVAAVFAVSAAIASRLWFVQVRDHAHYADRARQQHERRIVVEPPRGLILDREGRELALSVETESLYAHPRKIDDPEGAAARIAPAIGAKFKEIRDRLAADKPFVYLGRLLEPDQVERLRQTGLEFEGREFGFLTESKRYYPWGSLGVHVVGYATIDGNGVEGIELAQDKLLRGDPSEYLVTLDGRRGKLRRLVHGTPRSAGDVVLSLDVALQHAVERELDRAMRETLAVAASAILIEPKTGHILALANRPAADPNHFGKARPDARVNRAVVHFYEPGSTFKIVPLAAAIERGRLTPGEPIFCEEGTWRIGKRIVRDVTPKGTLTVREVLQQSSNIGMVKIARRLQEDEFYETIRRFGFGTRTGVELPGENPGMFSPVADWNGDTWVSLAYGYEIGVTPLQLVSSLATVANGGVRMPPRVVLGFRHDGKFEPAERAVPETVISEHTARLLASMMEDVVASGTGSRASVPGYRLAGKTGTANKANEGGYSESAVIASFGGFGPVDRPRLAGLVVLDTPAGARHLGGQIAAPVFRRIMADALRHLRVPPDEDLLPTPSERADQLMAALVSKKAATPESVEDRRATTAAEVPDVVGMSLREAVKTLAARGLRTAVTGSGTVASQDPPAGTPLDQGRGSCRLALAEPKPGMPEQMAALMRRVEGQRQ